MLQARHQWILAALLMLHPSILLAQEDHIQYGLYGTYQSAGAPAFSRVDTDLMFDWTDGAPAVTVGPDFQGRWTGQILIRSQKPYRFSSELLGHVTVQIGEQTVFDGRAVEPTYVTGEPVDVPLGFQDLQVTFQSLPQGGMLKLFWATDDFQTEPVPAHLLFHEDDSNGAKLVETGRQLFEAHRCHRCHTGVLDQELLPAPALWGITNGTNPQWIVQKLMNKNAEAAHAKMPDFGLDEQQADDIAQYLHRLGVPFDLVTAPAPKENDKQPSGDELLHSLGCLGCHQVGELGTTGPFAGSDLTHIGAKRSPDWLATWLSTPERINPQHHMPAFKLDRTERGLLAHALSKLGREDGMKYNVSDTVIPTVQVDRGRELVKRLHCANCHKIPAIEADLRPFPQLRQPIDDWSATCLADKPDLAAGRPHFPKTNREALKAYVNTIAGQTPHPLSTQERGRLVLNRNNCLGCHRRGMELGLASSAAKIAQTVPELAGHPQVLIPPSLNAVGDKLLDPVLKKAVSGDQDRARADWLKVQMPRFKHADTELADLVASLVSYDRIPDEAAQSHPEWNLPDDELLLTGRTLIGAGAFTCIACHQVGDYVPRNVAIGTKGSDLKNIGKRLRPEFYYRWTRDPLRVVPGMEMPAYKKPVPHVLDEDLHKQLAVVWRAVNDESFQAPTNPTQVEQFWQVSPDGPPRIVRDVFTVDKANGNGFIARAMAIGLPNKHALLLDLDDGTLRGWTYGDFARQRTEGKSWYWELAGSPVAEGLAPHSDWQIRFADGSMDLLFMKTPSQLKLDHYETRGDSVHIDWHAEFPADQTKLSQFRVTETISPIQRGSQTGWKREVRATGLPPGASLGLGHNASWEGHFDASMNVKDSATEREDSLVWWSNDEGQLSVEYLAKVPGQPTIPVPEKVVLPFEEPITTLPGYTGQRLRLPETIMPTSITWDQNGKLVFTSLKGHVYRAIDTDKDGLEDELQTIEEGLAAPFGILTDGADLLVAHKPELLRLIDGNGDGRADERHVIADGWGYTDNYHDWTTGPVRGKNGEIFLALGSDYAQQKRDRQRAQWRGKVLRLGSNEQLSPFASELRYPIGIAADGQGRLFVTDQQGVQNTFNEINLVTEGGRYGVPGLLDEDVPEKIPTTIQVPHPWTRSVNGIFFLPDSLDSPFAGHGIGCEYNGRFLVRFTTQFVDGAAQGAVYPFTRSDWESDLNTFLGPMSGAVSPTGDIYIGSIHDSGWLGGRNTGEIVRLKKTGNIPNGIREVRATHEGFAIEFVRPVNRDWATRTESYAISAYTRVWQGSYATDDSERHAPKIVDVKLAEDGTSALLTIPDRRIGFVYEFQLNGEGDSVKTLFPTFAAFTLNRIPTDLH